MSVSISIENIPDYLVKQLQERAKKNHHSLQDEILAILKDAVQTRGITPEEARQRIERINLPSGDPTSAEIIIEIRDSRHHYTS